MNEDQPVTKRCSLCQAHKPTTEFSKSKRDGYQSRCKPCDSEYTRQRLALNPYRQIFSVKRASAKVKGIEFTLTYEDVVWNEYCPVLGTKLAYERNTSTKTGAKPNSPSFDRIDPTKGYVPGNVIIVSTKANSIKSNATVDELKKVAAFYEQLIPTSQHGDYDVQHTGELAPQPVLSDD